MGKVCGITHPYLLVHHHALHLAIPVGYCANRERAIYASRDRIDRNGRPMLPWWGCVIVTHCNRRQSHFKYPGVRHICGVTDRCNVAQSETVYFRTTEVKATELN
jgi:hypothetical protein